MAQTNFALHETLDMHELLTSKTVCLTEAKARLQLVQDPALKALIQQDIQQTSGSIKQMQSILTTAATQLI
jgi:similar to spore coat protein